MRGRHGNEKERDSEGAWIAVGISLVVLAALPLLVIGPSIGNVAMLGAAGAMVVGAAYLLAVKYLKQRDGHRVSSRPEAQRGPAPGS